MITCIKKLTVNSFIKNAVITRIRPLCKKSRKNKLPTSLNASKRLAHFCSVVTYDPVFSSRDGKERTLNVVKIPEPGISSDWSRNKRPYLTVS